MSTQQQPAEAPGNGAAAPAVVLDEAVARFERPRLPWHDAIGERFKELGVSRANWKVLVEALYPSAKTVDAVVMVLSYCQARKLDPFKRPVHIVPMYDARANDGEGGYVETVWPSIAELRTTAFRTGQYAGCSETKFGPHLTKVFKGRVKVRGQWQEISKEITFPEWAQITVVRALDGIERSFVGPKVYWLESFAKIGRDSVPNDMWERRPNGQLEKVAEAAALRKAFPEEIGNDYSAEEMEGQHTERALRDVTPRPKGLEAPPPPAALAAPKDKVINGAAPAAAAPAKKAAKEPAGNEAPAPPKALKKQAATHGEEADKKPAKEPAISAGQQRLIDNLKAAAEAIDEQPEKPFDQGLYLTNLEKKLSAENADLDELGARHDAIADKLNQAGKIAAVGLFKAYGAARS